METPAQLYNHKACNVFSVKFYEFYCNSTNFIVLFQQIGE